MTLVVAALASAVPSGVFVAVDWFLLSDYEHLPVALQWLVDHLRVEHQTYAYIWYDGWGSSHTLPWTVAPVWTLGAILAVLTATRKEILWYLAAAVAACLVDCVWLSSASAQLVFDIRGNGLIVVRHHAWDGYVALIIVGFVTAVLARWRLSRLAAW